MFSKIAAILFLSICNTANAADGDWISVGIPSMIHQGTDGRFYLNGTTPTACNGVTPDYFRVDTNAPHWKEFYALILFSSATNRGLDCVVKSGCGESQVWIDYCRVALR